MHQDVERYLAHLASERRLSPLTVENYQRDLEKLIELAGGQALQALDSQHIRHFIARLHGQGQTPSSLARRLSCWRGFYRFACKRLGFAHNPCDGLRAPKAQRTLPKVLPLEQCMSLLDHPAESPLDLRDRAMFELFYSSGLRLAELASLDMGSMDLASGEARVTGKGGKTRIVPVGNKALAALHDWLQQRPALASTTTTEALFLAQSGKRLGMRQIQQRLSRWAQRCGLPVHVHPHMLRHAFATHVLQSSGNLRAVQELLGHANISTTQIYTHLDYQHLARAYDQAHPRAKRTKPA